MSEKSVMSKEMLYYLIPLHLFQREHNNKVLKVFPKDFPMPSGYWDMILRILGSDREG